MKTLIIGGNRTIGKKVSFRLSEKHDIIIAGRSVEGKGNGEIIRMYE